jgi:hypothetical protein
MIVVNGKTNKRQDRPNHRTVSPGGLVEILRTYNRADMAIIESVLNTNGIEHIVVGGNIHYSPMKVLVGADHVGAAYELVKKLKLSYSLVTSGLR